MQVYGHYLQRYGLRRPGVGARNLHFDPAAHDDSDAMAGAHILSPSGYPQWQRETPLGSPQIPPQPPP